jgi:peptidoglycan/LPS O-acetylase OafA/YrhL
VLYALLLAGAMYFILSAIQAGNAHVSRWIFVPIKAVSDYSYTLYLVHYSVLVFLAHWNGEVPGGVLFVIGFVACNVISAILYVLFECRYRSVAARLKQVFILREPRGSVS